MKIWGDAMIRFLSTVGVAAVFSLPTVQANAQSIPSTLGWHALPNTKIEDVCAATHGFPQVTGNTGCNGIFAWSGAVFDTTRDRMIVWGGGHSDYYGNELYSLNLNSSPITMTRLNDPGLPIANSCQEAIAGGTQANSRHTYDGIEYMPNVDRMFVFSGSLACGSGNFGNGTWTFSFATNKWQNMNPNGPNPVAGPGRLTAYDPNSGRVFVHDNANLFSYDFSTNTYTKHGGQSVGYHMTATIDPVRKLFVMMGEDVTQGGGRVHTYDISPGSSYSRTTRSTTGCSGIINDTYPGIDYDPVSDRIVGWGGGNTVYSLNTQTWTCTTDTYTGGPGSPSQAGSGTHGRWRYSPTSGVFVLVNEYNQNAYAFRRTSGGGSGGGGSSDTSAPSIPTNLSANAVSSSQINLSWNPSTDNVGVAGYRIFRNGTQISTATTNSYSDNGLAASTQYFYTISAFDVAGNNSGQSSSVNTTTLPSGGGGGSSGSGGDDFAARCAAAGVIVCRGFDSTSELVKAQSTETGVYPDELGGYSRQAIDTTIKASGAGSFRLTIPGKSGQNMNGSYREVWSPSFGENSAYYVQYRYRVSPNFANTNWTSLVGTAAPKISILHYQKQTCSDVEWTTNSSNFGNGVLSTYVDCGARGGYTNNGVPPYLIQQGDFNCPYGNTTNNPNCLSLVADKWMTFYFKMSIGTWGNSNSHLEAWYAVDGGPYKKWIDLPNFELRNAPPEFPGYNSVSLLSYMTGKNSSVDHATAYVWYDDLIVSTQPIAAPGGGGGAVDNTPPASPKNLNLSIIQQ